MVGIFSFVPTTAVSPGQYSGHVAHRQFAADFDANSQLTREYCKRLVQAIYLCVCVCVCLCETDAYLQTYFCC